MLHVCISSQCSTGVSENSLNRHQRDKLYIVAPIILSVVKNYKVQKYKMANNRHFENR